MKYGNEEIDLRSGDLVLTRNEFVWYNPLRYISAAIRFFTGVKYNHAKIAVNNWGKLMLNEAIEFGVISRPAEKFLRSYKTKIIVLRPKWAVNEKAFCERANSALGRKYDYKGLFFHQLWYRLSGKWIGGSDASEEKTMVCTEYAAWCHGLKGWWLYSAKEFLQSKDFQIVYEEN